MADNDTIRELLRSSGLAFAGAVEAVGKTTVAGVDPDDRTVVVQVREALHTPPGVSLPPGSRVTLQLSAALPQLEPGATATFFANSWVYGESLGLMEVGRMPDAAAAAPTARLEAFEVPVSPVQAALAELADEKVLEHAREADAIVRGHVVGLNAVPKEGPPKEHDPDWWVATLEADVVHRGELPDPAGGSTTVPVLYANSLDVMWRDAPKPKAGQSGMWILHRAPDDLSEHAPFQVLHAIDLQPSLQLDLLRDDDQEGRS